MEIESSLKTKWQRIKCKINALLGFYRKTIPSISEAPLTCAPIEAGVPFKVADWMYLWSGA